MYLNSLDPYEFIYCEIFFSSFLIRSSLMSGIGLLYMRVYTRRFICFYFGPLDVYLVSHKCSHYGSRLGLRTSHEFVWRTYDLSGRQHLPTPTPPIPQPPPAMKNDRCWRKDIDHSFTITTLTPYRTRNPPVIFPLDDQL